MRAIKFRSWNIEEKRMDYDIENDTGEYGGTLGVHCSEPNEVVMQFTGLLDKSGKEIWEGDIVDWKISEKIGVNRGQVVWYQSGLWLEVLSRLLRGKVAHHDIVSEQVEVIGNIYEHPELLKGSVL